MRLKSHQRKKKSLTTLLNLCVSTTKLARQQTRSTVHREVRKCGRREDMRGAQSMFSVMFSRGQVHDSSVSA